MGAGARVKAGGKSEIWGSGAMTESKIQDSIRRAHTIPHRLSSDGRSRRNSGGDTGAPHETRDKTGGGNVAE
jgi:hypothetical protein